LVAASGDVRARRQAGRRPTCRESKRKTSRWVDQDAITLQGQRRHEQTSRQQGYYRSERNYGSFYRTIPLPEGADPSTASATFRDGVLEIALQAPPKRAGSRSLEIKDEHGAARSSGGESSQKSGGQQQR
jgi:HSP20 family protein